MPTREQYFRDLETSADIQLDRNLFHIIRVDGRAFHTLTRGLDFPMDEGFMWQMDGVAQALCEQIQGARFAFVQSDEISILVTSFGPKTQMWFGGLLRKWLSISAGLASAEMSLRMLRPVQFDSRVLSLSRSDAISYFLWRQGDCARNAIQAAAQHHIGHKKIRNVDRNGQLRMLEDAGVDFEIQYPQGFRNGRVIMAAQSKQVVTWTHKKTGQVNETMVDRSVWTSKQAPWFDWDEGGFLGVNVPPGPLGQPDVKA